MRAATLCLVLLTISSSSGLLQEFFRAIKDGSIHQSVEGFKANLVSGLLGKTEPITNHFNTKVQSIEDLKTNLVAGVQGKVEPITNHFNTKVQSIQDLKTNLVAGVQGKTEPITNLIYTKVQSIQDLKKTKKPSTEVPTPSLITAATLEPVTTTTTTTQPEITTTPKCSMQDVEVKTIRKREMEIK